MQKQPTGKMGGLRDEPCHASEYTLDITGSISHKIYKLLITDWIEQVMVQVTNIQHPHQH